MPEDGKGQLIIAYRCIYYCSQQWQGRYIDCTDRIATTSCAGNCIGDRTCRIKQMTEDGKWQLIIAYRCIYYCSQQRQGRDSDCTDRIAAHSTAHRIGD